MKKEIFINLLLIINLSSNILFKNIDKKLLLILTIKQKEFEYIEIILIFIFNFSIKMIKFLNKL